MARRPRREDERVGTAAAESLVVFIGHWVAMSFARRFTQADGEYGDDIAPRDAMFDSGEEDWSIPFRRAVSMPRGVVEVVASSLRFERT
jgi:hypothetical protein